MGRRPTGGGGLTWPRGAMGYLPPKRPAQKPPQPLNLSCHPHAPARGFGHDRVAAAAKGDGWQGADRPKLAAAESAAPLLSMRRRPTGGGGRTSPRGARGSLPHQGIQENGRYPLTSPVPDCARAKLRPRSRRGRSQRVAGTALTRPNSPRENRRRRWFRCAGGQPAVEAGPRRGELGGRFPTRKFRKMAATP